MRSNGVSSQALFSKRRIRSQDLKFHPYDADASDCDTDTDTDFEDEDSTDDRANRRASRPKEPKSNDLLFDFAMGIQQNLDSLASNISNNASTIDDAFQHSEREAKDDGAVDVGKSLP
eukprot:515525_1